MVQSPRKVRHCSGGCRAECSLRFACLIVQLDSQLLVCTPAAVSSAACGTELHHAFTQGHAAGNSSNNINATTFSAPAACPPNPAPSPAPAAPAPVPGSGYPPSSPNVVTPPPVPKDSSSSAGAIAGELLGSSQAVSWLQSSQHGGCILQCMAHASKQSCTSTLLQQLNGQALGALDAYASSTSRTLHTAHLQP